MGITSLTLGENWVCMYRPSSSSSSSSAFCRCPPPPLSPNQENSLVLLICWRTPLLSPFSPGLFVCAGLQSSTFEYEPYPALSECRPVHPYIRIRGRGTFWGRGGGGVFWGTPSRYNPCALGKAEKVPREKRLISHTHVFGSTKMGEKEGCSCDARPLRVERRFSS